VKLQGDTDEKVLTF